jgi:hypothetical protein
MSAQATPVPYCTDRGLFSPCQTCAPKFRLVPVERTYTRAEMDAAWEAGRYFGAHPAHCEPDDEEGVRRFHRNSDIERIAP